MIASFIMTSLDGFFEGDKPWEIEWHRTDDEFNVFATEQLDEFDTLVFGRATYEGMAGYWPSDEAARSDPEVASRMNGARKIVVSRTLDAPQPAWTNTTLVKDARDLPADGRLLVLGSAVLTTSLLEAGLLDELRIMLNPVLIGSGRSIASSATRRIPLRLLDRRDFRNGNILLTYAAEAT
ncbi:MAG TPA: dihydrofolate reductase family protein [Candidatus Dormibacteraeota bacterium]|nr:dihydrofolate reductase family protein [Candidatus Dormibacteraeota bacterium]